MSSSTKSGRRQLQVLKRHLGFRTQYASKTSQRQVQERLFLLRTKPLVNVTWAGRQLGRARNENKSGHRVPATLSESLGTNTRRYSASQSRILPKKISLDPDSTRLGLTSSGWFKGRRRLAIKCMSISLKPRREFPQRVRI